MTLSFKRLFGGNKNHRSDLTDAELRIERNYLATLPARPWLTGKRFAVVLVGLVGSGITTVAQALERQLNAVHIKVEDVELFLRADHVSYECTQLILEHALTDVFEDMSDAIIDGDRLTAQDIAAFRKVAEQFNAEVIVIRVTCDIVVQLERMMATVRGQKHPLKLHTLLSHVQAHYEEQENGLLKPKDMPFELFATIDTTQHRDIPPDISRLVQDIIVRFRQKPEPLPAA